MKKHNLMHNSLSYWFITFTIKFSIPTTLGF
nr:MAG TPA: hypothetical protein [Bacteriophage sp.]